MSEDPFPELPDPQVEGLDLRYTTALDGPVLRKLLDQEVVRQWLPCDLGPELENCWKVWMAFSTHRFGLTAVFKGKIVGFAVVYPFPYVRLKHQGMFSLVVDPEEDYIKISAILLRNLMYISRERFHLEFLHTDMYKGCPLIPILRQAGFECYARQDRYIRVGNERIERSIWQKNLMKVPSEHTTGRDG